MSEISNGGDSMDVSGETTFGGSETETSEAVGTVSSEVNNASDLGIETGTPGVEGVLTGHEVSISSTETTHGMNQILETPETLELAHAQAQVESVHHYALASILERDGAYISSQDHARIEAGITSIKALDNIGSGKTGGYHFDSKNSSIRVASLNEAQRERSTIHETHHFASLNREIMVTWFIIPLVRGSPLGFTLQIQEKTSAIRNAGEDSMKVLQPCLPTASSQK